MNRRELLSLGGAALSVAALPTAASARASIGGAATIVLYDAKFDAARRFAEAATQQGSTAHATQGDVPSLWFEKLRGSDLAGLRGMTTYADMMAVAALAREQRREMHIQVAHLLNDEKVSHRVTAGPANSVSLLRSAGQAWPEASWSLVTREFQPQSARPTDKVMHRATLWSWAVA